jgi:hypothetical protein
MSRDEEKDEIGEENVSEENVRLNFAKKILKNINLANPSVSEEYSSFTSSYRDNLLNKYEDNDFVVSFSFFLIFFNLRFLFHLVVF